jgi:hypothetical protein
MLLQATWRVGLDAISNQIACTWMEASAISCQKKYKAWDKMVTRVDIDAHNCDGKVEQGYKLIYFSFTLNSWRMSQEAQEN